VERNESDPSGEAGEYLSHRWGADSRWQLNASLDPEHGALVQSAIETIARTKGLTGATAGARIQAAATLTVCRRTTCDIGSTAAAPICAIPIAGFAQARSQEREHTRARSHAGSPVSHTGRRCPGPPRSQP
jgi:hypothetical protein